jgi:succinate dehydrogenase / fumarate reductase flavoprotein subunit
MHGSNRLGGNSLSDLLVFGRRAGEGAAAYVKGLRGRYPVVSQAQVNDCARTALEPLERSGGESPYELQQELQQVMNDLVGIIRRADEISHALDTLDKLKERSKHLAASGPRDYNPGWHLALDLRNMLSVAECVARAALMREESRGGHTRDDYPTMSEEWRKLNLICAQSGETIDVVKQETPPMRADLMALFTVEELKKYFTPEELQHLPAEARTDIGREVEISR